MMDRWIIVSTFPVSLLQARESGKLADWRVLKDNWSFTGKHLMPAWSFFIIATILILVIMSLWLWRRYQTGQLRSSPLMIFHHVARRRGLSLADQWLLIRIAKHQSLPTPLTLLLSSRTLRCHASHYVRDLRPTRRGQARRRIDALDRTLYRLQDVEQPLRHAA